MCGIIAYVGRDNAVPKLVAGLENLEYRGYDSAGIAVRDGEDLAVCKDDGKISDLKDSIVGAVPPGTAGIGHTRWSTHGPPTPENAHPHTGERGDVAVVHNGIIENHEALREQLEADGRTLTSDTDTEVVPHLIEQYRAETGDVETAFQRAVDDLEGSYAIVAMADHGDVVYGARQGSPLVLGVDDHEHYLASDVPAFLDATEEVCYLEDGDVVRLTSEGVRIVDGDGEEAPVATETVDWDPEETGKGAYDHYMLKEIEGQPDALRTTLEGRIDDREVTLDEFPAGTFDDVGSVHFVACGTSYHASMFGARMLNRAGVEASAYRASEYNRGDIPVPDDAVTVAVTQSGETADTLQAVRRAQDAGAPTIAVTNVIGSTAAREVDRPLYIRAGPEIGVAATKTFTSQVVALTLLADRIVDDLAPEAGDWDRQAELAGAQGIPDAIESVLDTSRARAIGRRYLNRDSFFFIGEGTNRPVALEGALKFKEITYEHAEGFAAGELKHGPLALVTADTVAFVLFAGDERDEKTKGNAREIQARGADVVAVAPEGVDVSDCADDVLRVPRTTPTLNSLLANVQLQLVSYYTADLLDRAIDKPRNLAKSVTVE